MFPAHAGMNRGLCGRIGRYGRVPRTRGDEPVRVLITERRRVCSPHTRG